MSKIIELVKGNYVWFMYYQDGNLWYTIGDGYDAFCEFNFPVPISECGSARFPNHEKATLFIKWIRRHLETLEKKDNG